MFVTTFNAHQDYFEKVYCVNKDKPELECHGKCHLNKVVEEQSTADETTVRLPFSLVYDVAQFSWAYVFYGDIVIDYSFFKIEQTLAVSKLHWSPPWLSV